MTLEICLAEWTWSSLHHWIVSLRWPWQPHFRSLFLSFRTYNSDWSWGPACRGVQRGFSCGVRWRGVICGGRVAVVSSRGIGGCLWSRRRQQPTWSRPLRVWSSLGLTRYKYMLIFCIEKLEKYLSEYQDMTYRISLALDNTSESRHEQQGAFSNSISRSQSFLYSYHNSFRIKSQNLQDYPWPDNKVYLILAPDNQRLFWGEGLGGFHACRDLIRSHSGAWILTVLTLLCLESWELVKPFRWTSNLRPQGEAFWQGQGISEWFWKTCLLEISWIVAHIWNRSTTGQNLS